MQIHLSALGCRLNEAELSQWASDFHAAGHKIVQNATDADVLILNTCAVTQEAVRKSRKSIQRLHRANPTAKLVVSGCYTTLTSEEEHHSMGIDLVVDNSEKDTLAQLVELNLSLPVMPQAATLPSSNAIFERNRQRAFIKIQDGCRYRCTYCIVTIARGEERSRPQTDIINEVNTLHASGVQEIVLTGVHVGGYGSDREDNLYSLVKALLSETDIPRIRFASVEPWDLPAEFFTLFENKRLMPHMHLPLQSGCDSVLKRMSRRCKTVEFKRLIESATSVVPGFNVTTDIIVGFPGETESEWHTTMDFVSTINFGHIHIFPFSVRAGTKAATLSNQVNGTIKRKRSQELHQLAAKQKHQTMHALLQQEHMVLFESGRATSAETSGVETKHYFGYTPNYCKVRIEAPLHVQLDNTICLTTLDKLDSPDYINGSIRRIVSQTMNVESQPHENDTLNEHSALNIENLGTTKVHEAGTKVIPIRPA